MNRTRSFIGDVSFQGMTASVYTFEKSVTYVAGSICHLCTRFEPSIFVDTIGVRKGVVAGRQLDLGCCWREASRGERFTNVIGFAAIFARQRACGLMTANFVRQEEKRRFGKWATFDNNGKTKS
ncbi:MAG TPA: hypothetical protein VFK05_09485, partial [Polyangiaceae bacterium]|nr:hypothetical protein [Polyangiaceae bacterium]